MMNHAFYVITYQSGGEGKGDTQIDFGTDRQKNMTGQTGRPMGI